MSAQDGLVGAAMRFIGGKPQRESDSRFPVIPRTPAEDPAAKAARDAAAEEERRRSLYGRAGSNPLGGLGDTSTPNLAGKSLLGL